MLLTGGGSSLRSVMHVAHPLPAVCAPSDLLSAGVQSPYNKSRDPWQVPEVRDYMRYYINMTSEYLLQARERRGWGGQRGRRGGGGGGGRRGERCMVWYGVCAEQGCAPGCVALLRADCDAGLTAV